MERVLKHCTITLPHRVNALVVALVTELDVYRSKADVVRMVAPPWIAEDARSRLFSDLCEPGLSASEFTQVVPPIPTDRVAGIISRANAALRNSDEPSCGFSINIPFGVRDFTYFFCTTTPRGEIPTADRYSHVSDEARANCSLDLSFQQCVLRGLDGGLNRMFRGLATFDGLRYLEVP